MQRDPTFAFVTIGSGAYLGSTARDIMLANALHRRGYRVVVYWMMECNSALVDKGIRQRIRCRGIRYHFRRPSDFLDRFVGPVLFLFPSNLRVRVIQNVSGYVDRLLENLIRSLFGHPEPDRSLVRRLLRHVGSDDVTHLMMSFASICPLALQAKRKSNRSIDYVVSLQGDEEFANHAQRAGLWDEYREGLKEVIDASGSPGIVVSHDYRNRIVEEMGIDTDSLRVVYNGIEFSERLKNPPIGILKSLLPDLHPDLPIVSYVGRQESEKGIDLLLYAAKMLEVRKCPMQLVICGSTAKGKSYQKVIGEMADHLRIFIHHSGTIPVEVRSALYVCSYCVVCPSINREPFRLVVAEAMSHGTPVLVPDYGGVAEVIRQGYNAGGLTFKVWDSGDLADQLQRLLTDRLLHRTLTANTRTIAARFSVDNMTDRVLEHIGLAASNMSCGHLAGSRCRELDPSLEN
jgi:glycosyltransferase involved in cell wall biosynthesis